MLFSYQKHTRIFTIRISTDNTWLLKMENKLTYLVIARVYHKFINILVRHVK